MSWADVQGAIVAWVEAQTGAGCVWHGERSPGPAGPYVSAQLITGPTRIGGVDELRSATDLGQPAGQEVGLTAVGQRRLTLSLQVVTRRDSSAAYDPDASALALAQKLQSSVALEGAVAGLRAAGLAVLRADDVRDLTPLEADRAIERAQLDVVLGLAVDASERVGYIERAVVSSSLGVDPDVELTDSPLGG